MPKRFYLATRKDREAEANDISDALTRRGCQRTFTWSAQDGESVEKHSDIAKKELDAICNSDMLIVLLPGGYGTHVEIGAALALGKPVILYAPDRETLNTPYPCIFHYHPGVKLIVSEVLDVETILDCLPSSDGDVSAVPHGPR